MAQDGLLLPKMAALEQQAIVEALKATDLFGSLPMAHIERIAALGQVNNYQTGDELFREGERGDSFYLVLKGSIRVSRIVPGIGEENLAVIEAGNYFGEMALIADEPRSATAIVHRACTMYALGRQEFQDLLFVDRDVAYVVLWKFVRTLSDRLRASNDKMTLLASASKF